MTESVRNNRTIETIPTSQRLLKKTNNQSDNTNNHINDEIRNQQRLDRRNRRPEENSPSFQLINTEAKPIISTEAKTDIDPETERDIFENPDWKLDLERSEYKGSEELKLIDGNLNSLMALVRYTFATIQQSLNTNERARISQIQDEIKQKIQASSDGYLGLSRISFVKGLTTLTLTVMPALPEFSKQEHMKKIFEGISSTSGAISDAWGKGYEASLGEVSSLMQILRDQIQRIQNESDNSRRTNLSIDEALKTAAEGLHRVQV